MADKSGKERTEGSIYLPMLGRFQLHTLHCMGMFFDKVRAATAWETKGTVLGSMCEREEQKCSEEKLQFGLVMGTWD